MTVFEHAMLGGTLALALGAQRRQGWAIVAMAAVAAALPDLDGLSILFPEAYGEVHRVWGHNLLVAGLAGSLVGVLGYWIEFSLRARRATLSNVGGEVASSQVNRPVQSGFSGLALVAWVILGAAAGLSHLPADIIYNGAPGLQTWPVPLFWPWDQRGWAVPVVPWGDVGTTLIFVGEMFALYRWPARAQSIAGMSLLAVAAYIGIRWFMGGVRV